MREGLIALGSVLAVDQVLKAAVLRAPRPRRLGPIVLIRPVRSGGPFVAVATGLGPAVLAAVWLGIVGLVLFAAPHAGLFRTLPSAVAMGAALGGAASNLLDRVLRGCVVDYVDLRVWPVFNLGDAAIVAGLVVALVAR
jgi:signal peptidase II